MNDQPTSPAGPGGTEPPRFSDSVSSASDRIQVIIEAAEKAAAGIIEDAEEQARRYLVQSRQRADDLAAERTKAMSELTDSLIERAERVKFQSDDLIAALGHARIEIAEPDALLSPPRATPAADTPPSLEPEPRPVPYLQAVNPSEAPSDQAPPPPPVEPPVFPAPVSDLPVQAPTAPQPPAPAPPEEPVWPQAAPPLAPPVDAAPPPPPYAPPVDAAPPPPPYAPPAPAATPPAPAAPVPVPQPPAARIDAPPLPQEPTPPPVPPAPFEPSPPDVFQAPVEVPQHETPAAPQPFAIPDEPRRGEPVAEPIEEPAPPVVPPSAFDQPASDSGSAPSAGARLLATQMAVAGSSREEIESRLQNEFGIPDAGKMLESILGREG